MPIRIEPEKSIITPINNGPKTEQIFPNIEYKLNADNWFFAFISFTKTLLLDACIGPIKNPIMSDIIQNKLTFLIQKSKNVTTIKPNIQITTVLNEPIMSSYLPKMKHPIIPNRLIKIPRNKIWDSVKPNKKAENILAKAKIEITALLKKK